MLGHFRNNMIYRLISIFAAITIWFFVFSERNPTTEDVVTVPLEASGLAEDLVIAEKPNTVNIRFQGKSNVVDKISSRDFRAHISLEEIGAGIRSVQVATEFPAGVRIVSVQPSWVQVQVDQVSTIQLPVELAISGEAASGYLLETPKLTPSQVIVKGPENHLENIGRVYVNASFNNISMNYVQSLPVLVEDKSGNLILDWLEVVPRNVDVLIPVVEDIPNRTVPIIIDLIGELQPGIEVDKVLVNPATVRIYGQRDIINDMGYLTLELDISELEESTSFEIEIELPEGIEGLNENTVQVIVEVVDEN
ncbi:MAG: hypothetical protein APF76_09185 [Desulfitibacter sp. BRH_c19]|nr:MAG: hypothetical protein APF76_09185 [Desulfitibacter sp. BRH_c19]